MNCLTASEVAFGSEVIFDSEVAHYGAMENLTSLYNFVVKPHYD